jgi:uncharacterized protein
MYPMSFDEFLMAMNENKLLEAKQKANFTNPLHENLHNKLLDYLFIFILIGSMPESVMQYVNTKTLRNAEEILHSLLLSFQLDFAKYKKRVPKQRIEDVFQSVVKQAGGKFMFSKVGDLNNAQVKEAVELLLLAGLIIPITHTAANGIPLGAEIKNKKMKMILLDTGLYQNILKLNLSELLLDKKSLINKGAIAEQFWGLEFLKYQNPTQSIQLYYWHREAKNASAEVDFIVQKQNEILPIEIKSSTQGSMQSIHQFILEKNKEFGYRFSLENYSEYKNIKVIPLYAISNFVNL